MTLKKEFKAAREGAGYAAPVTNMTSVQEGIGAAITRDEGWGLVSKP